MTTDPDEERLFTSAEKRDYNPLRCPDCGRRSLYYDFAPAGGGFEDPAPRFRRGRRMCRNEGCPTNAHAQLAAGAANGPPPVVGCGSSSHAVRAPGTGRGGRLPPARRGWPRPGRSRGGE
jgi:hypothetical protein